MIEIKWLVHESSDNKNARSIYWNVYEIEQNRVMLRVQQEFIKTKHIKLPKKGYNTGMVKEIIKYETPKLSTIIVQQK